MIGHVRNINVWKHRTKVILEIPLYDLVLKGKPLIYEKNYNLHFEYKIMPPRKKKEQNSIVIHPTINESPTESEDERQAKKHLEDWQKSKNEELASKKPALVTTEPAKKTRKPRTKPVERAPGHKKDICKICHEKLMTQKIKIGSEIDVEIKSVLLE
jgi:hypothetical protein